MSNYYESLLGSKSLAEYVHETMKPQEIETHLQTHPDTKQHTCRNELAPLLRECHTERSAEAEDRGKEDSASTREEVIKRVGDPGGAVGVSIERNSSDVAPSYKTQMAIYGVELINPMIQEFLSHMAAVAQCLGSSEIPRASAKVRLAPLEAAQISIVTKSGGISYQFGPILGLQLQQSSR
jgi:hypothetical protein